MYSAIFFLSFKVIYSYKNDSQKSMYAYNFRLTAPNWILLKFLSSIFSGQGLIKKYEITGSKNKQITRT